MQRKTLIKSEMGVRLERIEELAAQQKAAGVRYRLSTYRPPQPRTFAEKAAAETAYAEEVRLSREDTIVQGLVERGFC